VARMSILCQSNVRDAVEWGRVRSSEVKMSRLGFSEHSEPKQSKSKETVESLLSSEARSQAVLGNILGFKPCPRGCLWSRSENGRLIPSR